MFGATFSIHSWILRKSTDTDVTILNKYHGHLDNHRSEALTHLEITILANGKISTSVDQVEDNSIYKSVQSGSENQIVVNSWYYIVYNYEVVDGDKLQPTAYLNNVQLANDPEGSLSIVYVDNKDYPCLIGAKAVTK